MREEAKAQMIRTIHERFLPRTVLALRPEGDDPLSVRDRDVLDALGRALDQLRDAAQVLGLEDRAWGLDGFVDHLRDMLAGAELDAGRPRHGQVQVLSAHEARTLSFDHVFVVGLTDQGFPAAHATGSVYGLAEADRWATHGVQLPQPRHLIHEEMLLYYASLTRARKHLVLCRSACSPEGREELASPFLDDTVACFAPETVRTWRQALGDVTPPGADDVWTPAHLRLFAVHEGLSGRPEPFRRLLDHDLTQAAARHMHHALLALRTRVTSREFGPYDGMLGADVSAWLHREHPDGPCMAVTRLEQYRQCPFAYFVAHVLGAQPLPEPQAELTGLGLGLIVHEILRDFHRELALSGSVPDPADQQRLLVRTCGSVFQQHQGELAEAERVLWEIEQQRVMQRLQAYLAAWQAMQAEGDVPWEPTFMEVSFGERPRPGADPASVARTLVAEQDDHRIALRGRVDRIDVARTPEGTVFRVIDYKTGRSAPRTKDIMEGTALQLPVYAWAAQRLLLAHDQAMPGAVGYWMVGTDKPWRGLCAAQPGPAGWVASPDWIAAQEHVLTQIFVTLQAMLRGEFHVGPDRPCPSYCDYRHVCRSSEADALGKTAPAGEAGHG